MAGLKLLFLGTSSFALPSLQTLQENFEVLAVVTRPDRPAGRGKKMTPSPVKEESLKHGVKIYQPQDRKQLYTVLKETEPQVLINVAFGMFLPENVLNFPPLGCVNLHPSLLPAYRGAAPIQRTLMNGEETTGITVLYMTPQMDAGDIILQEEIKIEPGENFGSLHDRLARCGAIKLQEALSLVARGTAPRRCQDETAATFAPALTKEEEKIQWSWPAGKIYNQVRALAPHPGAYTVYRQKRLKVWETMPLNPVQAGLAADLLTLPPGTVCQVARDYFTVTTGAQLLKILLLQPAGRRKMSTADFLKGNELKVGEKLA
ncbi:MAG: methionyl-tRNA formyltransferase [Dethiobacteria bacterium]